MTAGNALLRWQGVMGPAIGSFGIPNAGDESNPRMVSCTWHGGLYQPGARVCLIAWICLDVWHGLLQGCRDAAAAMLGCRLRLSQWSQHHIVYMQHILANQQADVQRCASSRTAAWEGQQARLWPSANQWRFVQPLDPGTSFWKMSLGPLSAGWKCLCCHVCMHKLLTLCSLPASH